MESYPNLEVQLLARIFAAPLDQTLLEQIPELFPELELPPDPLWSLAIEFSRLFVGPGPGLAPPYASYYLEQRNYGEAYSQLALWFEQAGVSSPTGLPYDHLAAELALLAFYLEKGQDAQALVAHLSDWIPSFINQLQETAAYSFYPQLAQITHDLVLAVDRKP